MTIKDFAEKYNLHDSGIEKIFYDAENKKLVLTIEFCFWMQEWFIEGELKNGSIEVTFENVSFYSYDDYDPSKLFGDIEPEILQTEIDSDGVLNIYTFEFVRYEPGEDIYPIIKIKAENVEVVELERYDL